MKAQWLLNYDGGAFLLEYTPEIENECKIRGVSYQVISDTKAEAILREISSPSKNMEAVLLEKAPKIAVYSPKSKLPWDDAVTMVLTYAEIPFDVVYDEEVLDEKLLLYELTNFLLDFAKIIENKLTLIIVITQKSILYFPFFFLE